MKPELILPGGDLERVKIAFSYGADAVYVGMNKHSLRKAEVRFDVAEIGEAIKYAHQIGKRLFVTFNIFAHNKHLAEIEKDMTAIAAFGPDAFIIADLGVMNIAKRVAPDVAIHVSTQANTVNIEDVKFWRDFGAKRVVLARELNLSEITEIHQAVPDIELEAFVHGSMCISYSGRCLMSNYMTGRDANLGECAQPCRWNYKVYSDTPPDVIPVKAGIQKPNAVSLDSRLRGNDGKVAEYFLEEANRPGEYFPIEETDNGTNIMSSKDLAAIEILPEILNAGVIGLKVEGRNKSEYYLATVGYTYREALNLIAKDKYIDKDKKRLLGELQKVNNREYTTGFYLGDAAKGETFEGRAPIRKWDYVGKIIAPASILSSLVANPGISSESPGEDPRVRKDDKDFWYKIIVKNKISKEDILELLSPSIITETKVLSILDENRNEVIEVNPGKVDQFAYLKIDTTTEINTFFRKAIS